MWLSPGLHSWLVTKRRVAITARWCDPPNHVLLTRTGPTRQKARSLATVAWLPLDCRAPRGAAPPESSQSPTVPATRQIFLPVRGGRSADTGCKAVEVGVGSFSGLSPAKSPLETFFFFIFPFFHTGPRCWPFCSHLGTFSFYKKVAVPSVCPPSGFLDSLDFSCLILCPPWSWASLEI